MGAGPALVLLLAALAAGPGISGMKAIKPQTLKGKAVLLAHDYHDQPDKLELSIVTLEGERVLLKVANSTQEFSGIRTGMDLEVSGAWLSRGHDGIRAAAAEAAFTFLALGLQASGGPIAKARVKSSLSKRAVNLGATASGAIEYSYNKLIARDVSAIIIPIAGVQSPGVACPDTQLPQVSAEELERVVFGEKGTGAASVMTYYNKCSYGKTRMTRKNSMVAGLVELPCSGTAQSVEWSMSTCQFDDFNGYADAADAALRERGVQIDNYKHRVYLLPPGPCSFVGLAYVGCDSSTDCRSWVSGNYWGTPLAIAHEIGHNLFLQHAGGAKQDGTFDPYIDTSGTMGYCCTNRCFNTPHAWQLGWITVQQLDRSSLQAGQTLTARLASQADSSRSGVRIVADWARGVDPVFLGFRTRGGGDAELADELASRVHIYSSAISNTYDPEPTTWLASLADGEAWEHPDASLVLRFKGVSRGMAEVSICRKGGEETVWTCIAGIDNDCNGLAGVDEPACLRRRAQRLKGSKAPPGKARRA